MRIATGGILGAPGARAVSEPAWKAANRAHWDELVAVHLSPSGYDLTPSAPVKLLEPMYHDQNRGWTLPIG